MAEVFSTFLGTNQINLDIHGFDPAGPPGSNWLIGPAPERPLTNPCQYSATVQPSDVMAPIPVTTMRRPRAPLASVIREDSSVAKPGLT
jgi:hypothetical protein